MSRRRGVRTLRNGVRPEHESATADQAAPGGSVVNLAEPDSSASHAPSPDPLVARVRSWIEERDAADALKLEWKTLGSALIGRHGGMTAAEAVERGYPEGHTMQDLERRCDALDRKLDRDAKRIAKTPAKTAEGALAKIELGLEIQSPFDRDEYVWALIEGGLKDLRELMSESENVAASRSGS